MLLPGFAPLVGALDIRVHPQYRPTVPQETSLRLRQILQVGEILVATGGTLVLPKADRLFAGRNQSVLRFKKMRAKCTEVPE